MRLIGGNISDTPVKEVGDGSAFNVGGGGGAADPHLANVALLLMPEDGDASIIDKSPNARTVTNTGPVTIVTDVNSPTGLAMDFGTTTQAFSLTFSDDAGLKPGTGDLCLECFAFATGNLSCLTGAGASGSVAGQLNFPWFYSTTDGPYGYPGAANMPCNDQDVASSASGVTWNSGAYHHWAYSRAGSTWRVFCDGVQELTGSDSTNIGATNWTEFLVGMWSTPGTRVFGGRVAMFRLTIGHARYTANFSPFALFPKV